MPNIGPVLYDTESNPLTRQTLGPFMMITFSPFSNDKRNYLFKGNLTAKYMYIVQVWGFPDVDRLHTICYYWLDGMVRGQAHSLQSLEVLTGGKAW